MSITCLQLIEDALREVNVISEVGSASAEQGKYALRKLNQMMALWRETKDIDIGYFSQTDTSSTLPIPEWTELAVTLGLAIAIASKYGATASTELVATANAAISGVQTRVMVDKKTGVDLSYLPVGSGHYGRGNSILTDS
jgi:hypothetical protein